MLVAIVGFESVMIKTVGFDLTSKATGSPSTETAPMANSGVVSPSISFALDEKL